MPKRPSPPARSPLFPLLLAGLWTGLGAGIGTAAADTGPAPHASGTFDATTGTYQVVSGDVAGAIAARFGMSLAQLEQQNNLDGDVIQVGQQLSVAPPTGPDIGAGATAGAGAAESSPAAAQPPAAASPAAGAPPDPWPRAVQVGDQALSVYQPQVASWDGNQLVLRAAVAVAPAGAVANGSADAGKESFGIVEATARTQVDRSQRMVVLEDLTITKADFPTEPTLAATLAGAAAKQFASSVRIIPLDRLEASLAASAADAPKGLPVQNPVPQIIVSNTPAILIPIQGDPVLKPVPGNGNGLQRVINTRAVLLTTGAGEPFYLHLLDGWVTAPSLDGPWTRAEIWPAGLDNVASQLAANHEADLLNGSPSTPTLDLLSAGIPTVYVSTTPAELIVFKGKPNLTPVADTGLLWAANTTSDILVDTSNNAWYALLAGRWYQAMSLDGPWTYVASTALPAAFARIPPTSPAGVVLASVAGTVQAREAVIANSIPQTATIPRQGGPTFTPRFDGPATIGLLEGTDLEYVVNAETPIVRVGGTMFYALSAGVWFQSPSLDGPWVVADSVPADIYGIPPSSPLHYVTYVQVYGATPEVVYDGYTPGYLGTVTAEDGVVVYGTGYDYAPWIGDAWYAAPETFGLAAAPVYNPVAGYAYGFGLGLATAAVADNYWGGAYYRPYDAGYGCCAATSANVYSHWGDTVAAGTRSWFAGDGVVGTTAGGDYANWRTGTTGAYAAGRSYNAWTGTSQAGYARSFDTAGGVDGAVARGERYNPATGTLGYGSAMSATGPDGGSVDRDTARAVGPDGSAAVHQTTVDNPVTGASHTLDTARVGNNVYAGADGNVYRNTGDGWQKYGGDGGWQDSGWRDGSNDGDWADREQQARSNADARVGGWSGGGDLGSGGLGDRFGGGDLGSGGYGDRFGGGGDLGGGGFGGRFGGGGGDFGGGSFGGRFGGGGFGGRFGGRR